MHVGTSRYWLVDSSKEIQDSAVGFDIHFVVTVRHGRP